MAASESKDITPGEGESFNRAYLPMVVVMMCGSFLSALNQNLMNTALPTFMNVFNITASDVQWLITAYTLANGVMIPVTAYFIGRYSTRKMYFWSMGLFCLGTALCAVAPAFSMLIVGRIVQALGAGISMTLMQTVLFTVFPPDKRGTAMGFFGLIIAFAPAFGPTLSGLIVDSLPWQAIFVIQLPVIAVLILLAVIFVKNVTGGQDGSLDVFSVVLSTLGFGGVLYGFGSAGALGFTSATVLVSILVGAVCIALFVYRQLHLKTPVLEFRVFTYKGFTSALILSVGTWCLFIGTAAVLPLFMQDMLGFSATQSGMTLMGGGIAMGLLSPVMGRVFDTHGPRILVPVGMALIVLVQILFARAGVGTTMLYLAITYAVFLTGLSMCNTPLTTCAINSLPQSLVAHGSAMTNSMRQTMSAITTAVFISLMMALAGPAAQEEALSPGVNEMYIPGVHAVFVILSILAVIMFIAAVMIFHNYGKSSEAGEEKAEQMIKQAGEEQAE